MFGDRRECVLNICYINQSSGSAFGIVRVGSYIDTSILTIHLTETSDSVVRCSVIEGNVC